MLSKWYVVLIMVKYFRTTGGDTFFSHKRVEDAIDSKKTKIQYLVCTRNKIQSKPMLK